MRWYHLYILLALFDVVVIMSSLYLHNRTLSDVGRLIEETARLDEEARWLNLARRRVLELDAPGNDLFLARDPEAYARLEQRFRVARANLSVLLDSATVAGLEIPGLRREIASMTEAAEAVFEDCHPMAAARIQEGERKVLMRKAGENMARMDQRQHRALWLLGGFISRNGEERNRLLQHLSVTLQSRSNYQRYFIAAVVVILVGILGLSRRLHRSEQALVAERRRVQEERRERLTAIGELCSSVAHGMRNPLSAICSSVELTLDQAELDGKTSERLRATLREGERLNNRINGLLDVARMNLEVREPVNLSKVVEDAARELGPAASRMGVVFEQALSEDALIIEGDRGRLELAVIELISNAVEHSKPGDTIRLACRRDAKTGRALLSVEDQGPGVPAEVRSRVFDLFFTTKPQGTGIGLASVKRIIRLHGGEIGVSSGSSGGACFAVTLPVLSGGENGRGRAA